MGKVRVAVHGCVHGDLKKVYELISRREKSSGGEKIDLLIILGDIQTLRGVGDIESISIPAKYMYGNQLDRVTDFPQILQSQGQFKIPVPTLVIGGNHENMKQFEELPHGGYLYPGLYYLGLKSVVCYRGLRIAGFSGITYPQDIYKRRPAVQDTPQWWHRNKKTLYHVRFWDLCALYLVSNSSGGEMVDMVLSHDWPAMATRFGNTQALLARKPYFRKEVARNELGSPLYDPLLGKLQPQFWLSSHLHVKWGCEIVHSLSSTSLKTDTHKDVVKNDDEIDLFGDDDDEEEPPREEEEEKVEEEVPKTTFLALDKYLPSRPGQSFEVLEFDVSSKDSELETENTELYYDPEYIDILKFLTKNKELLESEGLVNQEHSFEYNFKLVEQKYQLEKVNLDKGETQKMSQYKVVEHDSDLGKQTDLFVKRFLKD